METVSVPITLRWEALHREEEAETDEEERMRTAGREKAGGGVRAKHIKLRLDCAWSKVEVAG